MFGNNDYRDYLMHKAADGSEWRNHKYIDKVRTSRGWRYIYPEHENPYKQSSRSISKAITKGGTKVYSAKQKFLNAYGPVATPERFRGGSVSVLGAKARIKLKHQRAKNRFTLSSQPVSKAATKAKRRIDSAKLNFMNYAHPQNDKTPIAKARQKASRFKRRNFETFARNARHIRQAT